MALEKLPAMVNMANTPEEKEEIAETSQPIAANQPNYPWGLSISLCNKELDKLGIDVDNVNVNDIFHLHCFAVVTSKSSNQVQGTEPNSRIELQITHIAAEDEGEEDDEAEEAMKRSSKDIIAKLYQ